MVLTLLACALLLLPLQQASPTPPPPADLTDEHLVEQTAAALQAATTAFDRSTAVLRDVAAQLGIAQSQLQALADGAPPVPVDASTLELSDVDTLELALDASRAYTQYVSEKDAALRGTSQIIDAARIRMSTWPDLELHAETTARTARSLLEELAASGGLVARTTLPGERAVSAWITVLDEFQASAGDRESRAADIDAHLTALSESPPIVHTAAAIARATENRDLLTLLLTTARAVVADRAVAEADDAVALRARLAATLTGYREIEAAYTGMVGRLVADWTAINAADLERATLAAPKLSEFDEGQGHDELRRARQRTAQAEAVLQVRNRAVELIDSAHETATTLRDDLLEAGSAVALMGTRLVELQAVMEVASMRVADGMLEPDDLPQDITVGHVWRQILRVGGDEARRTRIVNELAVRIADDTARAAAIKARDDQAVELERARMVLREESEYGAVVEQIRTSTVRELLEILRTDGQFQTQLDDEVRRAAALRTSMQDSLEEVHTARSHVDEIDTPFAQREIDDAPERANAIRDELDGLAATTDAGPTLPRDAAVDRARSRRMLRDVQTEARVDSGNDGASPSEEELLALSQDQRASRERHRYFDSLRIAVDDYRARADAYATNGAEYVASLVQIEKLQRQRYAAARELRRRVGRDEVPIGSVATSIAQHETRDDVASASAARGNARTAIDARSAGFDATLQRLDSFLAIMTFASRNRDYAEQKVDLIGQPVARVRAARTAIDELPHYEREELEYAASIRAESDDISRRLLALVSNPTLRNRYEDPLAANYLEIVNLERIRNEYDLAREGFIELIRVTRESREAIESAIGALQSVQDIRLHDYRMARYAAAIAARPDAQIPLRALYREAYGEEMPTLRAGAELDVRASADRLLSTEARLWGDRRWIAQLEHRLSRLGLDTEINRYDIHVSEIGREIEAIDGSTARLQARVERLQDQYGEALEEHGVQVLIKIAIIPVAAFAIVRLLRMLLRSIMRRSSAGNDDGDDSDRTRRLKTLTTVAGACVTVLVWALASIYMLASIGIDVTPIVASASVAGLAVAFGAQTLIRDFFAGFFILLENQFTVGDIIDVGKASGSVEHISLRITTLRDLEGVVHYVPNGMITHVSNKTKEWSRALLEVQVSYEEDLERVTACLESLLAELHATSPFDRYIIEAPVVTGVQTMTENAIGLRVMAKTRAGRQWEVAREIRRRVRLRFRTEGIEAPYPKRIMRQE